MTRSVINLELGSDNNDKVAFLLPKEAHVDRVELTAATRADYTVPSGTRKVIFFYAVDDDVFVRVYTDSNLATASGNVTTGEAAYINPSGLADVEPADIIQFISATAGAVHIACFG